MKDVLRPSRLARFADFEVDLEAGELRKNGHRIRMPQQAFQILTLLLERPGRVVTREELQKLLWPNDTIVEFEHSINAAINRLREALCDSAEEPRYVETLPRRGYRFIYPVGAGLAPPSGAQQAAPPHRLRIAAIAAGLAAITLATAAYWLIRPVPPPRLQRMVALTESGIVFPRWSYQEVFPNMVTDGPRVYTMSVLGLVEVSAIGGEARPIPLSLEMVLPRPLDISPDGSRLLIREAMGWTAELPLWVSPTSGGSARRVGDLLAHDAAWLRNGEEILYAYGQALHVAKSDGSESRKLATLPGRAFWPRWSPDGSRARFTLRDPRNNGLSLWEVSADGTNLRPLLPDWNNPSNECCGSWTPDGRYFVFQATRGGSTNIWAVREKAGLLRKINRKPVQLTSGPFSLMGPVPSKDGRRLFAMGLQPRVELLKHESASRQFGPYLTDTHASWIASSRDGMWVAYTTLPEQILWRSKADGSERIQLTSPPMEVMYARWSPDGRRIAFMGKEPGKTWKNYIIPSSGGNPQQLLPDERSETDPNWSPDGNSLVFGRMPDFIAEASEPKAIHVVDLKTRQVSTLPGSDRLYSPHWSPDGRYIVAVHLDVEKLMLFDFTTQRWAELAARSIHNPDWSSDGKYVYFQARLEEGRPLFRVRISDHKLERILNLKDLKRADALYWNFAGVAPDGSVAVALHHNIGDVYALDWEAP